MKESQLKDEIDLVSVFDSIKKAILGFVHWIQHLIQVSINNIKIMLLFVSIGVGISVGIFFTKKPVYTSTLSMSHTRLNNGQCMELINGLTKTPDKNKALSQKLNISADMATQIKDISCKLEGNLANIDSLTKISDFKIEVKVYDFSILDSLETKILNFLESNEYARKRKVLDRAYLDNLEDKTKKQIIAIDSLKTIVEKSILPRSIGNGIILGESIDPVKVYQESMSLYQTELRISKDRELNNSFEVIVGFSTAVPTANLLMNIIIGLFSGYIIGLIWVLRKKTEQA
jgi:uncharacterized protein YneF (UPF0154 family)